MITEDATPDRTGLFAGDDPFVLARAWFKEATASEPNDPDAVALSTVDAFGLPNVRMVLLRQIEDAAFVFFTNYGSVKAQEMDGQGKAAFVWHSKTLRRQIRVRGLTEREDGPKADAYYEQRSIFSRIGAWASDQSKPLAARAELEARVTEMEAQHGPNPARPPFWGGFRLRPLEIEFWADGEHRLHNRFRWTRDDVENGWTVIRLYP